MKIYKSISILFAFSVMILITSCSKADEAGSTDFIANAGTIHNQLLDNYYQNRLNTSPDTEELISEIITMSSEYLVSFGYDQKSVLQAESLLKENYRFSNLKSVMNDDFSVDIGSLAEHLEEMGLYSSQLIIEVKKILTMVTEGAEIKTIANYVNSVFSLIEFSSQADLEGQSLFVNIFNGSNSYWEDVYTSDLKGRKIKDGTWVIINDGIGGLLGMIFGPPGSIITATVFSAGTYEEINK